MKMEYFLGSSDNLKVGNAPLQLNLGRWKKALCPKIRNNEVSTNESLLLVYAQHGCMLLKTLMTENMLLELE